MAERKTAAKKAAPAKKTAAKSTTKKSTEPGVVMDGDQKVMTVGEAVEIPKGETFMALPDGAVVTVRRSYVLNEPGLHVCGSLRVKAVEKEKADD